MFLDELTTCFDRLEESPSRLRMYEILGDLFNRSTPPEISEIACLCEGRLLPAFEGLEIGMGEQLLTQAIASAASRSRDEVHRLYKKTGDLGVVAEIMLPARRRRRLTVAAAYTHLLKVARTAGPGSVDRKIELLAALLKPCSAREARWIVRFVSGRLRTGAGPLTILEAVARCFSEPKHARTALTRAWNLCSDLGLVLKTVRTGGIKALAHFKVRPGKPVRLMMAERLSSAEEIMARLGVCAVESKLDGFRCELHIRTGHVEIFSRNQERTTQMFPDLVSSARKQLRVSTAILDGEAVAINDSTGELYPFQVTVQRKRTHSVQEMARAFPLVLFVFDLLYANGKDYTNFPYEERRKAIEQLLRRKERLRLVERIVAKTPEDLKEFFDSQIDKGLEGIIAKRLDAPYEAGARNFNWIKLKQTYQGKLSDAVDVVIVGYFRGRGMRARLGIGAILLSVFDPKTDNVPSIANVGSGFSDAEWVKLRRMLDQSRAVHQPARVRSRLVPDIWAEPKYVVPVLADQITRSPVHLCAVDREGRGLALRFPRAVGGVRDDKSPEDATSVSEIRHMFRKQA